MSSEFFSGLVKFDINHLILIDYISLILIVIVFLYFQYFIIRNVQNERVLSKSLLSVVSGILFLSVVGLITQPLFKSSVAKSVEEITIISSIRNGNVDELIEKIKADRNTTFVLSKVLAPYSGVIDFTDITYNIINSPSQLLLRLSKDIASFDNKKYTLKVVGDGLNAKQIKSLSTQSENNIQKIIYETPTSRITGVIKPSWDNKINLGEFSIFRAEFQTDVGAIHSLRLLDPTGQLIEELEIEDGDLIELKILPKTFGLMIYQIEVFTNGHFVSSENVPIEVTKQTNLKMLILQSSPSFETKQLKNWAGDNNALVVVNTNLNPKNNLSRLINVEEGNRERYKLLKINETTLTEFDILIIDSRRLNRLTKIQKLAIKKSVSNGLGVIVLLDNNSIDSSLSFLEKDEGLLSLKKSNQENQSILYVEQIEGNKQASRYLLSENPISHVANHLQLKVLNKNISDKNIQLIPLITNSKEQVLVAQIKSGLGSVSYSLLKDTFRWVSNGEKIIHSRFWNHLLKSNSRKNQDRTVWINNQHRRDVGNKERLCVSTKLVSSSARKPELSLSEILSLSDDKVSNPLFNILPTRKNNFCAAYWPEISGWHQLKLKFDEDHEELYFYVYPDESWLANKQLEKIKSTNKYEKLINSLITEKGYKNNFQFKKIELWVYWILIILSLSYIWIERKYST